MKKINTFAGLIALTIGLSAFSYSAPDMNRPDMASQGCERPMMRGKRNITPEMEQKRIAMEEKELAIKKELIKDSPNWTQIEKLNREIAVDQASMRTSEMKQRKENEKNMDK